MSALRAATPAPGRRWTPPISPAAYDRRATLSREEWRALALIEDRPGRWPAGVAPALSRLIALINDVLAVAGLKPGSWAGPLTRGDLLAATGREGMAFWGWDRERWARTRTKADVNVRQLVIAVAYLLCGVDDLHSGDPRVQVPAVLPPRIRAGEALCEPLRRSSPRTVIRKPLFSDPGRCWPARESGHGVEEFDEALFLGVEQQRADSLELRRVESRYRGLEDTLTIGPRVLVEAGHPREYVMRRSWRQSAWRRLWDLRVIDEAARNPPPVC